MYATSERYTETNIQIATRHQSKASSGNKNLVKTTVLRLFIKHLVKLVFTTEAGNEFHTKISLNLNKYSLRPTKIVGPSVAYVLKQLLLTNNAKAYIRRFTVCVI